ncbi:MAG: hypothetical protein COA78_31085 [Blastopirellula sp.]|nr:MAG: hypothetical protein COA78_31085 [Blastopirellula sp.]
MQLHPLKVEPQNFSVQAANSESLHIEPRCSRGLVLHSLLCCLLLFACGCSTFSRSKAAHQQVVKSRQLTQEGIYAMQRGNWDEAERKLKEAKENCPYDIQSRTKYAETLWNKQEFHQAIEEMESTIQLSGEDSTLMVQLGTMHFEMGKYQEAEQQAEQAIRLTPQLASAWVLKGDIARGKSNLEQARNSYLRAIAIDRELPEVQLNLAQIFRESGEPHRALICLNQVENQHPPGDLPASLLIEQGITYKTLGRYEDASLVFAEAVKTDSNTPELMFQWAESEMLAGRLAKAQWIAQQILSRNPTHANSQQLMAEIPIRQQELVNTLRR